MACQNKEVPCKCCTECPPKCREELCVEKLTRGYIVRYRCEEFAFQDLCDVQDFLKNAFEKVEKPTK